DDPFFGARRLWLAQYSSTPSWQESWSTYWLWQFTDGVYGPQPHSIDGIGPCDINSYPGSPDQLAAQSATGHADGPQPGPPAEQVVNVLINAPSGVDVKVRIIGPGQDRRPARKKEAAPA